MGGLTAPLNLPAPGRRQTLYVVFVTLQSPVFLVNSRLSLFAATPSRSNSECFHATGAPLIPKLRGQVAEFLNERSLVRLRILFPPTCVGLRYGYLRSSLEDFLGSMESVSWFARRRTSPLSSALMTLWICLQGRPGIAAGHFQSSVDLSFCVTPLLITLLR